MHGNRRITADTAPRLGRYFGIEDQLWLNLQSHDCLERHVLGDELEAVRPLAS